jgi:hypothetical protein
MSKKKETWRDLLLMAGIEAPIWWSGHKHKKVFNQLMTGDMSYLKEVKVKEYNVFNIKVIED